jgi:hypothetical protein
MIRQLIIPRSAVAKVTRDNADGSTIITFDSQEDRQIFDGVTLAQLRVGLTTARQTVLLRSDAPAIELQRAGSERFEALREAIALGIGAEP